MPIFRGERCASSGMKMRIFETGSGLELRGRYERYCIRLYINTLRKTGRLRVANGLFTMRKRVVYEGQTAALRNGNGRVFISSAL
ncbi:hypothetical protein [Bacteroides acidifaciens]|uniref:hypothetical protein n=1 Tax=Bacteroides acidifaciens TaxID=85831 RepID=UPI002607F13D|nr:hypothetical protein [Bacteroides acidifaciens]